MHAVHEQDLQLGDLIAAFWAKYPDADKIIYEKLFKSLVETPVTPDVGLDILRQIKRRKALLKLSEKAFRVAQGLDKEDDLEKFIQEMPKDDHQQQQDLPLLQTSNDLSELLEHSYQDQGYRWRLDCLNKSLGSLRRGDFGFLFARPETGKTTFLASEITSFLSGSKEKVVWLNNEEQGIKVMLRVYQAYFGVTTEQLLSNTRKYKDEFIRQTEGRFYLFDSATIDRKDIETIVKRLNPGVVVYDQIDKIKGFSNDREDLRLGSIYQWARELAKGSHAAIGVCQADGGGEGVRFLTMEHVANAKTAKQAEADWILGIGKIHEQGAEYVRYLNICKNKLLGDKDSMPDLRHGRFEVMIKPEIARYKDIIKYD